MQLYMNAWALVVYQSMFEQLCIQGGMWLVLISVCKEDSSDANLHSVLNVQALLAQIPFHIAEYHRYTGVVLTTKADHDMTVGMMWHDVTPATLSQELRSWA